MSDRRSLPTQRAARLREAPREAALLPIRTPAASRTARSSDETSPGNSRTSPDQSRELLQPCAERFSDRAALRRLSIAPGQAPRAVLFRPIPELPCLLSSGDRRQAGIESLSS